ncbi:uncharacterized protein CLUP02_13640 [Colletotrichum lupini]|uniref:Uncharacterized protein n=1 Tax=Colletotrichum lupini TaxID=145971 RepID=A0A9Q8WLM0_9PEZI|nr:uncharacterized protein CLUP02_13640 [Colletotrichum lupini]UQC88118.1 hypothetical protein CLUP02_13640 [Colletotrichum lupini]
MSIYLLYVSSKHSLMPGCSDLFCEFPNPTRLSKTARTTTYHSNQLDDLGQFSGHGETGSLLAILGPEGTHLASSQSRKVLRFQWIIGDVSSERLGPGNGEAFLRRQLHIEFTSILLSSIFIHLIQLQMRTLPLHPDISDGPTLRFVLHRLGMRNKAMNGTMFNFQTLGVLNLHREAFLAKNRNHEACRYCKATATIRPRYTQREMQNHFAHDDRSTSALGCGKFPWAAWLRADCNDRLVDQRVTENIDGQHLRQTLKVSSSAPACSEILQLNRSLTWSILHRHEMTRVDSTEMFTSVTYLESGVKLQMQGRQHCPNVVEPNVQVTLRIQVSSGRRSHASDTRKTWDPRSDFPDKRVLKSRVSPKSQSSWTENPSTEKLTANQPGTRKGEGGASNSLRATSPSLGRPIAASPPAVAFQVPICSTYNGYHSN